MEEGTVQEGREEVWFVAGFYIIPGLSNEFE
jgi:hypothetical protein